MSATEWSALYAQAKAPWRSSGIGNITRKLLKNIPKRSRLLEIGCGVGDDAKDLIGLGFEYDGIDLSREALAEARVRLKGTRANLLQADFFSWKPKQPYAVIYDKGVLHGLARRPRELFAHKVTSALIEGGVWITVVGAADDFDLNNHQGGVFLTHIAEAVEPYFEILEIRKGSYGLRDSRHDFDAWYGFFRRR